MLPLLPLLIILSLVAAAPPPSSSTSRSTSTSARSLAHAPVATASQLTVHNAKPPISQSHHLVPDPTRTPTDPSSFTPRPNPLPPTFTPSHTRSPKPVSSPTGTPVQSHGQKPISIVFEVLGGLFASIVLLGIIRCLHNYCKTPPRDRIADIVQRHQLQREMEELERNPDLLRRDRSVREPAPPYFPRPPSYDQPSTSSASIAVISRQSPPQPDMSQYAPVATHSPPSSPPISERILQPEPAAAPRTHPELP